MELAKSRSVSSVNILRGFFALIPLFVFQVFEGKFGWAVANSFTYDAFDPDNLFAGLFVHHLSIMLISLAVILIIRRVIRTDFGFHLGDKELGKRILFGFIGVIAVIAVVYHILMEIIGQPITYDYPLTAQNILGYFGFQLFLTGPAEETLYRALTVPVIVFAFGKSIRISENITLEVVLAALLFAVAHMKWTIFPFAITDLNVSGVLYAFAMGILNGVVYQKTRSILYPMLMHSISNVLMVGTGYLFALLF